MNNRIKNILILTILLIFFSIFSDFLLLLPKLQNSTRYFHGILYVFQEKFAFLTNHSIINR